VIPLFRILVALELLSGSLLLIFGHRMLPQWLQVDPSASAVDIPQQFLSRCQWLLEGHGGLSDDDTPPFYNPRSAQPSDNQGSVLIKNCTLWDGISDSPVYPMDILVLNGTVQSIDRDIRAPRGVRIIHAHGRIVTPGLVDVHSHSGLSSWPAYDGNDDVNEASSPLTPQMRSLDGFSLHDNSFYLVTTGGVTTSLILPVYFICSCSISSSLI
jgi:hypothetical protein